MSRKFSSVTLPPTPAPSSDIAAKDKYHPRMDFELPPPAMRPGDEDEHAEQDEEDSSSSGSSTPTSSYHPASPPSPPRQGVRNSTAQRRPSVGEPSDRSGKSVELPPPPTRPRKIIQMKPKNSAASKAPPGESEATEQSPKSKPPAGKGSASSTTGSKRKAATGSTQTGRKIARKTAHSLIERRRRSKMNEEFGVLKNLVPACEGIEMHKLAILQEVFQAAIDYVRYLHQCVDDLRGSKERSPEVPVIKPPIPKSLKKDTPYPSPEFVPLSPSVVPSEKPSPAFPPIRSPNTAPYSATLTASATSTTPSPVILANHHQSSSAQDVPMKDVRYNSFSGGGDENHSPEATAAALLMLNSDRRAMDSKARRQDDAFNNSAVVSPVERRKRMSVEDLLSK
ncbi:MAG: hypothetical protein Q9227_005975 [Pyrenula ochraceoflavens]